MQRESRIGEAHRTPSLDEECELGSYVLVCVGACPVTKCNYLPCRPHVSASLPLWRKGEGLPFMDHGLSNDSDSDDEGQVILERAFWG
jgi:hypothetical protein